MEEKARKAKKDLEDALDQKGREYEKQLKREEEAAKKREQEGKDAYKPCWNCGGKGWIGKSVAAYGGGRTNIHDTCSICNGTGQIKK